MHEITRYHDFSMGHRVVGHEGKCRFLHGHNYRIHFTCIGEGLDDLGRVIDFGVIKGVLCQWLEDNWDHKMVLWSQDPICAIYHDPMLPTEERLVADSIVEVPFNPTAENIGEYLVETIAPQLFTQLQTHIRLIKVVIEETRKCSATYTTPGMRGNIG